MVFEKKMLKHGDPEDEVVIKSLRVFSSRHLKCVAACRSYETLCSNC